MVASRPARGLPVLVLAALLGCSGAEAATSAELCAGLTQLVASADELAEVPRPTSTPTTTDRRMQAAGLADDVETARELALRQEAGTLAPASAAALRAGDLAAAALREGGDAYAALARLSEQAAAALRAAGCAGAADANSPSTP